MIHFQAWPYRYLQGLDAGTALHLTMNRAGRISMARDATSGVVASNRQRLLKFGALLIGGFLLLFVGSQVFPSSPSDESAAGKHDVAKPVRECRESDILGKKLEPSKMSVGSTSLEFGGIRVVSLQSVCNPDIQLRVEVHEVQKDTWIVKKIIPSG